jgi:hypothetical protein
MGRVFEPAPAVRIINDLTRELIEMEPFEALALYARLHPEVIQPILGFLQYFLDPDVNSRPLEERQLYRANMIGALALILVFPEEM